MIASVDCSGSGAKPGESVIPICSRSSSSSTFTCSDWSGHGRVAPRVAAALRGADAEVRADLGVQPLGQALGRLDAEAVDEQLLGELALGLEARHQLGDLRAGR